MTTSTQWRLNFSADAGGGDIIIGEIVLRTGSGVAMGAGTPSAPVSDFGSAASVVDGAYYTYWGLIPTHYPNTWAFTFSTACAITDYDITPYPSAGYAPSAWTLEYYDGTAWVVLDTRSGVTTGWTSAVARSFTVTPPVIVTVPPGNLRIVADNAMARAATLTADTTTTGYPVTNLLLDTKSLTHRATTTSVVYTATWSAGETLSMAAAAFCNLSPTATIRVQLYDATTGGTVLLDTTAVLACPAAPVYLRGFTPAQATSAYAWGGGATARAWFTSTPGVKRMVMTIADTAGLQGYVECSRLICGAYWSPVYNADYGATLTPADLSTHVRSDAGDLLTNVGTRNRALNFTLSYMNSVDRTALMNILRGNGMAWPVFISLLPGFADLEAERDHQIYGKLTAMSAVSLPIANEYSSPLTIEEC